MIEVYGDLPRPTPFDYLALHPYPNAKYGPDSEDYMHAEGPGPTILHRFVETMALNGDGDKKIWVTELGWNSSKESSTRPTCLKSVLVTEQEQAEFLQTAFAILIHEVHLIGRPVRAVDKVFVYQYMDLGAELESICPQGLQSDPGTSWKGLMPEGGREKVSGMAAVDWWFGLYEGDGVTLKDAWCTFVVYPRRCEEAFAIQEYLPQIQVQRRGE